MSPGKEKSTGKPKLSREQLRRHGIDFNEKVSDIDELDIWLQPISRTITLLQEISKDAREPFKTERKEFYLNGQDRDDVHRKKWCLMPVQNRDHHQRAKYTKSAAEGDDLRPESCSEALDAVQDCRDRNEGECKWTQVFLEHVFWDYHKVSRGLNSYEQRLNRWELQQDVLWNEFPSWARLNPEIARVTQPKPDLTYAFPIISPNDELFRSFKGDRQVDSFSLQVLGELRNGGKESLISAPTTALHNWALAAKNKVKFPEAKDLMCFPWAIVEIKRGTAEPVADCKDEVKEAEAMAHKKRAQFCYCQAANASAAGLILRENLAVSAKDRSKLQDARVMFSITCVGSAAKLWITYREKPGDSSKNGLPRQKEGRITMVCIWATSLELSWGIMALRMIVKNVKDWAYTRVKPEISRWIHDIRQDRLQIHSLTPSGDLVMQRRRAASCGPSNEAVDLEKSVSPTSRSQYCTPRRKARPNMPHGNTAPGSLDCRLAKSRVPEIKFNGLTESDEGGVDNGSDEGYVSNRIIRRRKSQEDKKKKSSAFICNDLSSEYHSDASYVPPISEEESTESENVEDEESDDDGASAFSRLKVHRTRTKVDKSSKSPESRSKGVRRRSSRF